jgi:nuclear transport factor 2 (NTF2) superfamily protein
MGYSTIVLVLKHLALVMVAMVPVPVILNAEIAMEQVRAAENATNVRKQAKSLFRSPIASDAMAQDW